MTTAEIEKRLKTLEAQVKQLANERAGKNPWWNKIAGVFANNPRFAEAMQLGRQSPDPRDSAKRVNKRRKSKGA